MFDFLLMFQDSRSDKNIFTQKDKALAVRRLAVLSKFILYPQTVLDVCLRYLLSALT